MNARLGNLCSTAHLFHDWDIYSSEKLKTNPTDVNIQLTLTEEPQLTNTLYKTYGLTVFQAKHVITLHELETEFTILLNITQDEKFWNSLAENEKIALEKYKLSLMQATQTHLINHYKCPTIEPIKPPKKRSKFIYLLFGAILLLELTPMIWGGYLGVAEILSSLFALTTTTIATTGITVCSIEAILYYSVMGPLLKESLGISNTKLAKEKIEIAEKQLQIIKHLDLILTVENEMHSTQYQAFARLTSLFNKQIKAMQTYSVYVTDGLTDFDTKQLTEKAIVITGDTARIVDHATENDTSVTLTKDEQAKLKGLARDSNARVQRTYENADFLDKIIERTTAKQTAESKLPHFRETPFKKGLRWVLAGLNIALNFAGGYFFALSLLAGAAATAALIGTPVGWGIIGLVILGQIALRLLVRSNAMFNMLNPEAERHKEVREKINQHQPNTEKYASILRNKKQNEKLLENNLKLKEENANLLTTLDKQRCAQDAIANPHIDTVVKKREHAPLSFTTHTNMLF